MLEGHERMALAHHRARVERRLPVSFREPGTPVTLCRRPRTPDRPDPPGTGGAAKLPIRSQGERAPARTATLRPDDVVVAQFPASCCGPFRFRPTRGRIPAGPHYGDVFGGWA